MTKTRTKQKLPSLDKLSLNIVGITAGLSIGACTIALASCVAGNIDRSGFEALLKVTAAINLVALSFAGALYAIPWSIEKIFGEVR